MMMMTRVKMAHKYYFIFYYIFVIILLMYIWNLRSFYSAVSIRHQSYNQLALHSNQSREIGDQLLILIWTWPFGEPFPLNTCFSVYGISGCNLTTDRSVYNHADAVIVHHYDVMHSKNLPPKESRPRYQRWIWFNIEPPIVTENLNMLDNLMNMTMTYRRDSDIVIPYGYLKPINTPQTFMIPTKTKLAAWVVSMWYPGTRRAAYYEDLKKYIQIDLYGKHHTTLRWEDFYSTISQYKFYLAFENCNHKDYITEKLWGNAFGMGAVPVVLGAPRENYERYMPSDSFIHVDDFSSPKELAEFLINLDKDDLRYKQYFNWRSQYAPVREVGWDRHYCKACRALHQAQGYQVIPSIAKWFLS